MPFCRQCNKYFHYGPAVCCLPNPISDDEFCSIKCSQQWEDEDEFEEPIIPGPDKEWEGDK